MAEKRKYEALSRGAIEVCRIMKPDDANLAGNVHGGTILKMIEEAGYIIATRHCNKFREPDSRDSVSLSEAPFLAGLVRVERTDFIRPLFIGEVAEVYAELSYASQHSLEVKVYVWAESLVTGERRLANKASLWYVPIKETKEKEIGEVPPLTYESEEEKEKGRQRYESQKKARQKKQELLSKVPCKCGVTLPPLCSNREEVPRYSVANSQSTLVHSAQPSDCSKYGHVFGGVTMKLMDEVAGMTAYRHCKTNVVTASIDAIDFHAPVTLGNLISITGRLCFTSAKSMEIEVIVDSQDLVKGNCYRACSAFFTFVSLDASHRPQPVPPLELTSDEERQSFEEGHNRYEERKQKRRLSQTGNRQ